VAAPERGTAPTSQTAVNHHAPHWIATACGLAMTG